MAEKITMMLLKTDLQCPCCYKKIKKLLSKFPQIRNQVFDEKQNTVLISVVCCSPEKIRDKLCRNGGKTIKTIEIIKPKPPTKPNEVDKPKIVVKPNEGDKPKIAAKPIEGPVKPNETEKSESTKKLVEPVVVQYGYPPVYLGTEWRGPYSEGYGGGPYYHGYERAGYGDNRGRRCDDIDYFSDENPSGCTIM